jgi:hypothetical protein
MINSVCKAMLPNPRLATAVVAGVILATSAQVASALTYTTTPSTQILTSLGDTIGSGYDQLQIQGATGTLSANTDIVLNTLTFTAGVNATVPATYKGVYSFSDLVTINSGPGGPSGSQTLIVPFNLTISYSDTLTVLGGSSVSVQVGSSIWNIAVNQLVMGPNPGISITESLMAHVTDPPANTPLPAAFLLFGSGLGAMEFVRRRRCQRKKAAPRTASA